MNFLEFFENPQLNVRRFYYICYKVIPIIHHEKKFSYTRLEPQLVEVLGWHQTMSSEYTATDFQRVNLASLTH